MFEKGFTKYARAVSDERERKELYQKYHAMQVAVIIFYTFSFLLIASLLVLSPYMDHKRAQIFLSATMLTLVGVVIANFCLWLSFTRMYRTILNRPALPGEMPEVTAYRQAIIKDKKSTARRLRWAWAIFGLCVIGSIVCTIMEMPLPPDEVDPWKDPAFYLLLTGLLTIVLAPMIDKLLKQQRGKTAEQQIDVAAIDAAQGRKPEYDAQVDRLPQIFLYKFPNRQLYAEAAMIRKRYSKVVSASVLIAALAALVATVLLLASPSIFHKNLTGYATPVAFTAIFGSVALFPLPMDCKLKALEQKQRAELETNPAYAKHLEWYRLHEDFHKCKGKIYPCSVVVSLVLGWVLAILFPASLWSFVAIFPMAGGVSIHNKLTNKLRQQAIPIEREIERQQQS